MRSLLLLLLGVGLAGAATGPEVTPDPSGQATSPTRFVPPPTVPSTTVPSKRLEVQRWTLEDGTDTLLVEDHRIPEVQLTVQFPVGSHSPWYQEEHAEEAWGLQHYDPEGKLRARANALAADLYLYNDGRTSSIYIVVLKRDLSAAVELVGDIFENHAYERAELRRDQQGRRVGWKAGLKDPDFRMSQAIGRLLFAKGDPRRDWTEAPLRVEKNGKKLAATRDVILHLPGRRIGFAGDLDRGEAEAIAKGLLPAPVATRPEGLERVYAPLSTRTGDVAVPMDKLTQVYFALVREGPLYTDPGYPAFLVANHVLGGHFFSRLYVALRHEGGETYGAYSSGGGGTVPAPYRLSTFTRAENRAVTEEKLRKVLQTYQSGITEAERADAIGYLQGSLVFMEQSPGSVLGTAMNDLARELPLEFYRGVVEAASRLSVDEINTFIKGFYEPAAFTMVTVEPE